MTKFRFQISAFLKKNWMPIVLLFAGLSTRFLFIWWPNAVVFDEVHFGKFVSSYFTHSYYFDIHPPLGKLLIALAAKIGGFHAGFSFDEIGRTYGSLPYVALRFLPNLAGAFIPLAAFWFFREFGLEKRTAFFAGLMLVLDNALLVQSHFILVDAFLILFGFLGLAAFWRAKNRNYSRSWLVAAAVLLGLAVSVKWTGLAFLAGALLVLFWDGKVCRKTMASALLMIAVALMIYILPFWIHFALLTASGPGDAFMQLGFQKRGFWPKFVELNAVMYGANAELKATHPYSSRAYTWPLMIRPVYFWVKSLASGLTGRIYLLGNPVVWWLAALSGLAAVFSWKPKDTWHKRWLVVFWLLNSVPFLFIGRVLFLYHYLPALIFSVGLWAGSLENLWDTKAGRRLIGAIAALAFIAFIFFAPLSYGLPLSEVQYKMRVWLPTWI